VTNIQSVILAVAGQDTSAYNSIRLFSLRYTCSHNTRATNISIQFPIEDDAVAERNAV
jgi:hypothetical protein